MALISVPNSFVEIKDVSRHEEIEIKRVFINNKEVANISYSLFKYGEDKRSHIIYFKLNNIRFLHDFGDTDTHITNKSGIEIARMWTDQEKKYEGDEFRKNKNNKK